MRVSKLYAPTLREVPAEAEVVSHQLMLRAEYAPYENFDAFKNRRIYSCNTGLVPYYEEFPLHPDYLLKDLIWVFHPELLPGYSPRYYRKMQD